MLLQDVVVVAFFMGRVLAPDLMAIVITCRAHSSMAKQQLRLCAPSFTIKAHKTMSDLFKLENKNNH